MSFATKQANRAYNTVKRGFSSTSFFKLPCSILPPGVRFNDCLFTEPVTLAAWRPPACPGIAAILVRNHLWAPKPLQLLYIEEFGNHGAWELNLPPNLRGGDVLISVLSMPFSTTAQRRALCAELVAAYNPPFRAQRDPVAGTELAQKLDELEVRQQEQSRQILTLLAQLGKMFEPQPVGPRRPIGFLPQLPTPAPVTETGS
jgi:hypothetical protein